MDLTSGGIAGGAPLLILRSDAYQVLRGDAYQTVRYEMLRVQLAGVGSTSLVPIGTSGLPAGAYLVAPEYVATAL